MNDLGPLRSKIDKIDRELIRLLSERAAIAIKVGEIKNRDGSPIFAPEREDQLLRALMTKNPGPLPDEYLCAVFREILSASRGVEQELNIACHSFSSLLAARNRFGACAQYHIEEGASPVFNAVASGRADLGVVPLDVADQKSLTPAIKAFLEYELPVCAQLWQKESSGDVSRFLVVGRIFPPASDNDQTLFMVRSDDTSSAMEALQSSGIETRFIGQGYSSPHQGDWLVIETDHHQDGPAFRTLLAGLKKRHKDVRILGSFPKGTIPSCS